MSLVKPLISYEFLKEMIDFVRWNERKIFFLNIFLCTQDRTRA